MKKIFTIWMFLVGLVATIHGQTLFVWQKNVATAIPADQAGTMSYSAEGTILTISGTVYQTNDIDSIVVKDTPVSDLLVAITYNGSQGQVVIPQKIASFVSANVDGAHVTVTSTAIDGDEVTYELKGASSDGSFTMNGVYKCGVVLNGLSLQSSRGAAINIQNGKRIDVILGEGTENKLVDCANGTQNACFYIKGHPEFTGNGTLILTGNTKHALASNEYLFLKRSFGSLKVLSAVSDGIHAGQYFKMNGGDVQIDNTGGDCIQAEYTNDPTDEENGMMFITGGKLDLKVRGNDVKGLKCDSILTFTGGTLNIVASGDGSKGISTGNDFNVNEDTGVTSINIQATGGEYEYEDPILGTETSKCMGIRVHGAMSISAGTITVTNTGYKSKGIKIAKGYTKTGSAVVNGSLEYNAG